MLFLKSSLFFILAGICEIGGGYLVWQSLRNDKSIWYAVVGCAALAGYGIVATWQPAGFGRVYASYGAVFILMSILWAMLFDAFKPDRYDIVGASLVLIGVLVMFWAPRP